MIQEVCGIPTVTIAEQPWVRYDVVTTHGSRLAVYFKHDRNMLNPNDHTEVVCRMGDLHISGFSELQQMQVNLYGVGFEPDVGGTVAVGKAGKRPDGTDYIIEELIERIENTQEVRTGPDL